MPESGLVLSDFSLVYAGWKMNFTTFKNALNQYRPSDIVFVGLGNEYRGDDAAGLIFFDRLRESQQFEFSHFVLARTNPENHLEEILSYKPKLVVFIDADYSDYPDEMQLHLDKLEEGYDMVIGSRVLGKAEPGALLLASVRTGFPARGQSPAARGSIRLVQD